MFSSETTLRLFDAVRAGDSALLLSCLPHLPADSRAETLNTAAVIAVLDDRVEALKTLLDAGVSPESKDEHGRSLARLAALKDAFDCLRLLHRCGATLHTPGDNSPLHAACTIGSVRCLRFLLEQGIPPDCKNKQGDSPAHIAAHNAAVGCLQTLHEAGADFHAKSHEGITPLNLLDAKWEKNPAIAEFLLKVHGGNPPTATSGETFGGTTTTACGESGNAASLKKWAGTNPDRLALIIQRAKLDDETARRFVWDKNFNQNLVRPGFNFPGLFKNTKSPDVGTRIMETTPLAELFAWAGNSVPRLTVLASHARLDYDAVRRLVFHPEFLSFTGEDSVQRFGLCALQLNPHAGNFLARVFTETPLPDLVSWVGKSEVRLRHLVGRVELPVEAWNKFILQKIFPFSVIDANGGTWAVERFLKETPDSELFDWAGTEESRISDLLARAPFDDATWSSLINNPEYSSPRKRPKVKYAPASYYDNLLPPRIHKAVVNPHLPSSIRDAINASLS